MISPEEISAHFDVLFNNITSNQAPGLNDYEKSVFMTRAQHELIRNHFDATSKGNVLRKGFDDSAARQMDFQYLVRVKEEMPSTEKPKVDYRSFVYDIPSDVYLIIGEQMHLRKAESDDPQVRQVIPISFTEYQRLMSQPYKEPFKRQAWRILNSEDDSTDGIHSMAEIVLTSHDRTAYPDRRNVTYIVRYVKKPRPIILTDLTDYGDLKIEGEWKKSTGFDFPEVTYNAIIQRAVEMANMAWETDVNQMQLQMTAGQRSE